MVLRPRHVASSVVDKHTGASPAVGPRALAALHELAVAASGVLEPTALAKHAFDCACDLLGANGAALYWWVSSTGQLHSLADSRGYQAGASRTLEPGKGVAGLAFQRELPLIIDDYPRWEGAVPWALANGVRAAVGIPLVARGRTVGAMAVLTHAVGGFDADDLRLLSLLAAQVAPSLEAGRLDIDLAASEQRFRSLYGSVASGVLVLSASGVIIQINPAGERIIGLSAEEMRGKTPDQLWHAYAEDGSELKSTDRIGPVVLRSRQPVQGVTNKIVLPHGRERWVLIDAIPVVGPDGQALQVVASFLVITEDITARKKQEIALEHLALHDGLTDLPNRTLMFDRLRQAILTSKREHHPLALLMMDLDRFKEINDTFGHHGGDDVLRHVSIRLKGQLRESDTVARLGGDEFAIILPGVVDQAAAGATAARILQALQEPLVIEDESLEIRASVGIALFPRHAEDADILLRRADAAMYEAKRAGAGIAFYTLEHEVDSSSLTLTFELRRAIEENALTLHYQPF